MASRAWEGTAVQHPRGTLRAGTAAGAGLLGSSAPAQGLHPRRPPAADRPQTPVNKRVHSVATGADSTGLATSQTMDVNGPAGWPRTSPRGPARSVRAHTCQGAPALSGSQGTETTSPHGSGRGQPRDQDSRQQVLPEPLVSAGSMPGSRFWNVPHEGKATNTGGDQVNPAKPRALPPSPPPKPLAKSQEQAGGSGGRGQSQPKCSGSPGHKGPPSRLLPRCARLPPSRAPALGGRVRRSPRGRHPSKLRGVTRASAPDPDSRGLQGRGEQGGERLGPLRGVRGAAAGGQGRAGGEQAHRGAAGRPPGASARPASAPAGSERLRAAVPCLWGVRPGSELPQGLHTPLPPALLAPLPQGHSHSALMAALLMGM